MLSIDLNCDLGEGFPHDACIMPFISSANIACGYHAGDIKTIEHTIRLAQRFGVSVGAHPSYQDRENFGRQPRKLSEEQYYDLVIRQLNIFQEVASSCGAQCCHVKPHGALYNVSAIDAHVASAIAEAVRDVDKMLVVYGLSGSHSITEAKKRGLRTCSEVFADRTYQNDGTLTPRHRKDALIDSVEGSLQQVLEMIGTGQVWSVDHVRLPVQADTVCLHGDAPEACTFAKKIHLMLVQHHIAIKPPTGIL